MPVLKLSSATQHNNTWTWTFGVTDISLYQDVSLYKPSTHLVVNDHLVFTIEGLCEPRDVWSDITLALLGYNIPCESLNPPDSHIDLPEI